MISMYTYIFTFTQGYKGAKQGFFHWFPKDLNQVSNQQSATCI